MARTKQDLPEHTTPPNYKVSATRKPTCAKPGTRQPASGAKPAQGGPREGPAAPSNKTTCPPPGLDTTHHNGAQRAAQQAEVVRQMMFPVLMGEALGYESFLDSRGYKVYLERLIEDAGNPADPVERMMLEQLALAHFRIGQLHVSAAQAKTIEAAKVYTSATARLWGEYRRTALALRIYRTRMPENPAEKKCKIFKMAQ